MLYLSEDNLCELERRCKNVRLYGIDYEEVRELDGKIRKKYGMNHEEVMASMAISAPNAHASISRFRALEATYGVTVPYVQKLMLVLQEFDESFMDQLVGGHVAACLWP